MTLFYQILLAQEPDRLCMLSKLIAVRQKMIYSQMIPFIE